MKSFRLAFTTLSRNTRDLIILTLRCFSAKNYLVNSKIIHSLDGVFQEGKVFQTDSGRTINPIQGFKDYLVKKLGQNQSSIGDLLLEIDLIKKEFYEVTSLNREFEKERKMMIGEVVKLEEDLESTIDTYTKLISEMKMGNVSQTLINESMISIRGKREEFDYRTKYQKLYNEKKEQEKQFKQVLEEVDMLRNLNKNEGYFAESKLWVKGDEIAQSFYFQKDPNLSNQQSQLIKENNMQTQIAMQQMKLDFEKLFQEEKMKNQKNIETIAQITKKLNDYQRINQALQQENSQLSQRSFSLNESSTQGYKQFETRLKEYKKLNEMLLTEINNLKSKNQSLVQDAKEYNNKIAMMQNELSDKNEQSIYRISSANDQIFLENTKKIERMLSEQTKKNEYLQQTLQQEINEKKSLQTQLSILKHKSDLVQANDQSQTKKLLNLSTNEQKIVEQEQQLNQSAPQVIQFKEEDNEKIKIVKEMKDMEKKIQLFEQEQAKQAKLSIQAEEKIKSLEQELNKKEDQLFKYLVEQDKLKMREETLNFKLNCLSQQNQSLQESQILMIMDKEFNEKECQTDKIKNYEEIAEKLQEEVYKLQQIVKDQQSNYEQQLKQKDKEIIKIRESKDFVNLEEENSSLKDKLYSLEMLNSLQKNIQTSLQEELELERDKVTELQQQFIVLSTESRDTKYEKYDEIYKLNDNFAQEKIILQTKVQELEKIIQGLKQEIKQLHQMDQNDLLEQLKQSNQRLLMENCNLMEQLNHFNNSSLMLDTTHNNINEQTEDIRALKAKVANLEMQNEELVNEKDQLVLQLSKALQEMNQ